jgi:hypothetical protein
VGAINALIFFAPTECFEIPDNVTFLQILVVVGRFIEARPECVRLVGFRGPARSVAMPQDAGPTALIAGPLSGNAGAVRRGGYSLRVITLAPVTAAPSCVAGALRHGRLSLGSLLRSSSVGNNHPVAIAVWHWFPVPGVSPVPSHQSHSIID